MDSVRVFSPDDPPIAKRKYTLKGKNSLKLSRTPVDDECNKENQECSNKTDGVFNFAPTTKVGCCSGVKAFVQVFNDGHIDASPAQRERLEAMGATVTKTLANSCTHFVFKDGHASTWEKAVKLKASREHDKKAPLYIVSPLWVQSCVESMSRVDENRFQATPPQATVATPTGCGSSARLHMRAKSAKKGDLPRFSHDSQESVFCC
eukprot:Rmarinus@m.10457